MIAPPAPVVSHSEPPYTLLLFNINPWDVILFSPRVTCAVSMVWLCSATLIHTPPGQNLMWMWTCFFRLNGHTKENEKTATKVSKQGGMFKFCMGLCHRGVNEEFGMGGAGWCSVKEVWEGGDVPYMYWGGSVQGQSMFIEIGIIELTAITCALPVHQA